MTKNLSKSENLSNENPGKNPSEKLLKVKEVAVLIGETEHILRNWLKDLEPYVPVKKNEAGYKLFDAQAVEAIRTIQHLIRVQGYSVRQVEHYFASDGQQLAPIELPDPVKAELHVIRSMLEQQQQFNQALLDRLDQQKEYIDNSLRTRDENLMKTIRALQEAKRKPKWFEFWKKD